MNEIVLQVEGLEFHADTRDDEPRVLDVEIGKRAGMARPTNIRVAVQTHLASGFLNSFDVRTTVVQRKIGAATREVTEYWFTEIGALKIVTKLETPAAHAMVGDMVRVYRAAIRMLTSPPSQPAPALTPSAGFYATLAACKTVGENAEWRKDINALIARAADRNSRTWQCVHGALRKQLGVVGYLRIPASLLSETKRFLHGLADGDYQLARRGPKLRLLPPVRQLPFSFERSTR